jgi:hypothetical protein
MRSRRARRMDGAARALCGNQPSADVRLELLGIDVGWTRRSHSARPDMRLQLRRATRRALLRAGDDVLRFAVFMLGWNVVRDSEPRAGRVHADQRQYAMPVRGRRRCLQRAGLDSLARKLPGGQRLRCSERHLDHERARMWRVRGAGPKRLPHGQRMRSNADSGIQDEGLH